MLATFQGVTTFRSGANSPEDALIAELDTIDLHHGCYSADPPYAVLEVIGALLTDRVKAEVGKYGFNDFRWTEQGFRAGRSLGTEDR